MEALILLILVTITIIIAIGYFNGVKPIRECIAMKEKCKKIEKEREQKNLELKNKYKNLKPEEIIFSNEVSNETIPYVDYSYSDNPLSWRFGMKSGDTVIAMLLSELYGYSGKEIEELIKTARKAAEKVKLQAVKKNIHKKANEFYGNIPSDSREPIPEDIQTLVWNRDGGKCVKCGSQEKLEFDHVIPVSKDGSNTARNIQLLCEKCNRSKHDKIGS